MAEGSESVKNDVVPLREGNGNIQDVLEEEPFPDILDLEDEDGRENDQQVDLFDTGNIWSQVGTTQAQRKVWQNAGNPDEEEFEPVDIDGRYNQANEEEEDHLTSRDSEFNFDLSQGYPEDLDGIHMSAQPSQSLWKEGKTAPLLNQYDEERRLWYLAQAGIYEPSDSVHDAMAKQTDSVPSANETIREPSSSPPIVVYQTPARSTTQLPSTNGSNSTSAQTHLPTPIQVVTNGVTPQRRGPAFSLVGNLNTPTASGQKRTPLQTPKRKTWQSTWASREKAKAATAAADLEAKSSFANKKRKSLYSNSQKSVARGGRATTRGGRGGSASKNATPTRTAGALSSSSARR